MQLTMSCDHGSRAEHEARRVDQVHAEIDEAAAACERRIASPGFVGTISVVEDELGREHASELAGAHDLSNLAQGLGVTIAKVGAEQTIGSLCCLDHGARVGGRASNRLLTKDRQAMLERSQTLARVERARR